MRVNFGRKKYHNYLTLHKNLLFLIPKFLFIANYIALDSSLSPHKNIIYTIKKGKITF